MRTNVLPVILAASIAASLSHPAYALPDTLVVQDVQSGTTWAVALTTAGFLADLDPDSGVCAAEDGLTTNSDGLYEVGPSGRGAYLVAAPTFPTPLAFLADPARSGVVLDDSLFADPCASLDDLDTISGWVAQIQAVADAELADLHTCLDHAEQLDCDLLADPPPPCIITQLPLAAPPAPNNPVDVYPSGGGTCDGALHDSQYLDVELQDLDHGCEQAVASLTAMRDGQCFDSPLVLAGEWLTKAEDALATGTKIQAEMTQELESCSEDALRTACDNGPSPTRTVASALKMKLASSDLHKMAQQLRKLAGRDVAREAASTAALLDQLARGQGLVPYIRIPTPSRVSTGYLVLQAPPDLSAPARSPGGVDAVYFEYVPVDDASITTRDFATLHRVLRAARATRDGTDECSTDTP